MEVAIDVAYVHPGPNLELLENAEVRIHRIEAASNYDPRIYLSIRRLISRVQPICIQTWLPQMDILGGAAAFASGIPHVLSERSSVDAYPATVRNVLRRWIGCRARAVVANSDGGARYWRNRGAASVQVIRNGIDFASLEHVDAADSTLLGIPGDVRIIVYAGRFSPEKNLEVLFDAFEVLLRDRTDCAALLFGDGELTDAVRSRVASLDCADRVRVMGFTRELPSWMRRASLFVSPSLFEGNPNSVLEAMAIGCPAVLSDIPQHREIADDASAWFFEPRSSGQLADRLLDALSHRELGLQKAYAARERVRVLSLRHAASLYRNLYGAIMQGEQS